MIPFPAGCFAARRPDGFCGPGISEIALGKFGKSRKKNQKVLLL